MVHYTSNIDLGFCMCVCVSTKAFQYHLTNAFTEMPTHALKTNGLISLFWLGHEPIGSFPTLNSTPLLIIFQTLSKLFKIFQRRL